jgi:hypothetical protein
MSTDHFRFVKSSYTAEHGECVEVALNLPGRAAIRDSKDPAPEVRRTVHVTATTWVAFTAYVVPEQHNLG